MNTLASEPSPRGPWLLTEVWRDSRSVLKAITIDVLCFTLVLAALLLGYLWLQLLQRWGYPKERLARFEDIHYWGYLCCQTMFVIDLLWKLFIGLFARGKK